MRAGALVAVLAAGCAPADLSVAGAQVAVLAGVRPECSPKGRLLASAGYNGRDAAANAAGVEAALRNEAALRGANAIVIRERIFGAPPTDPLAPSRRAISSRGCPNCVSVDAEAYRCPHVEAAAAKAVAAGGDGGELARATDAAIAAAVESARRCLPAGSAGGEAQVRVTFAASGDVVYAEVEGAGFAGTPVGECVARKLRNAHVPAFGGESRSIERVVKIVP